MPKLKTLSGNEIIKIFEHFDFFVVSQKGSHVKLQRKDLDGSDRTLTVPRHSELDKGTVKAIFNQAIRYISENELRKYFYTE